MNASADTARITARDARPGAATRTAAASCAPVALALCACASPASAHLVQSGVGPFYDGAAHLFLSPEDLVVVLALALLAGLYGRDVARRLVLTLPVAWLAGMVLGSRMPGPSDAAWLPIASLAVGLLVAIHPKLASILPAVLAAAIGLAHGFYNGRAITETSTSPTAGAGIVSAVAVCSLLIGALATAMDRPWQRIAIRALGSWAAAFSLLVLAWAYRPTPPASTAPAAESPMTSGE